MNNQTAYETRRRMGDSTAKINRTVGSFTQKTGVTTKRKSMVAKGQSRLESALKKSSTYTFNDQQSATAGFKSTRTNEMTQRVKSANSISGNVGAGVIASNSARRDVTLNPSVAKPKSAVLKPNNVVPSYSSTDGGLRKALRRRFDKTAGGQNFISAGGRMLTGTELSEDAIRGRGFKDGAIQRQIDFQRQPVTGTGGAVKQALDRLGTGRKKDAVGRQTKAPISSVRLPFANERSNPFVAGISKEGVTYARGSRMDIERGGTPVGINTRPAVARGATRTPSWDGTAGTRDAANYRGAQMKDFYANRDANRASKKASDSLANETKRIESNNALTEKTAKLAADTASAAQDQANNDREFNFNRQKFGANKIIGKDGNAYSNKDRIAAYNARPDTMASMPQADFEYQTYGKVSDGMSGDYLDVSSLVGMLEGGELDQGSLQRLLARTRDPEKRSMLSKQLEDYFNQQGGA